MKGIRIYTPKGQERWINSVGQIVPVGWFDSDCQPITQEQVSVYIVEPRNPYDQEARDKKILVLTNKISA